MAEVLITLGIIGVVAAMTIPTLMTKIQEKELYASWKRVYGILNQAYKLAADEYGDYSAWEGTGVDDYAKVTPYLKLANACPPGTSGRKCFPQTPYTCLNGTNPAECHGDAAWPNQENGDSYPSVRLLSGESILFRKKHSAINFLVDLNGDKKPNVFGIDLMSFAIKQMPNGEYMVLPGSGSVTTVEWTNQPRYCSRNSTGTWIGDGCGYWVLKHGNMDYLHLTDEQIRQNW